MSLTELTKQGSFRKDGCDWTIDESKLSDEIFKHLEKEPALVASLDDSSVYQLTLMKKDDDRFLAAHRLPVDTKQSAALAGYTEASLLKMLECDFIVQNSLIIKVRKKFPWWA
jgi:hypothetical protein